IGCVILGPILFNLSIIDSLIVGAVLGAVTPSILIPKMIELINAHRGTKHKIPQILIAGASIDDIFCIILFASFIILKETGDFQVAYLLKIPIAIATGLIGGYLSGLAISRFFDYIKIRDTIKILIILSIASCLVLIEGLLVDIIPFSGLLAVMTSAIVINTKDPIRANRLSYKFNKLWLGAQLWVFALVGASLPLQDAYDYFIPALILIMIALVFRSIGVVLSLSGNGFTKNEIIFSTFASIPKGTVQAAIGGIALAKGLSNGEIILAISVVSIIVTAPLGAILIDRSAYKLLPQDSK
ncbi:MAG: cation:proton antiporter, partial [Bacilli bacterium]